jgi:hypothetical protein
MSTSDLPTADGLRLLLRRGLPAATDVIPNSLLDLPGVRARSATDARDSRAAAFNTLLRQLLQHTPDPGLALAANLLFGAVPATAGSNLTARRSDAAGALGRDPDHFRKHIEPRILTALAQALAADSDRMRTTQAVPPRLIPVLGPPAGLPEDMWAWEAVEHEEHIVRLWASVYALRAELLSCERLVSFDPLGSELTAASEAALWRAGQLYVAIRAYRRAYGARLLHGDVTPDSMIGLAGWSPALSPDDVDVLCHHKPDTQTCRTFITDLTAAGPGTSLRAGWVAHFSTNPHTSVVDTGSAA